MSISRACYVSCDRCGDPAPISTDDAAHARLLARQEGYIRDKGSDLCPRCHRELEAQS